MTLSTGFEEFIGAGSYTFTPETGVDWVLVEGVGGGGGGGVSVKFFATCGGGSGGGAGESIQGFHLKTTPGVGVSIVVGAGGPRGDNAQRYINTENTAEGTSGGSGSGGGGEKTYIGPLVLMGGWGGRAGSIAGGNAGMGGGYGAGLQSGNFGAGGSNAGTTTIVGFPSPGFSALILEKACYWGGSGGGGGSRDGVSNGADGGACGPWAGGVGGANVSAGAGGGGGASIYGPGGAGGAEDSDAPAATSYGAGGGGAGGNTTTYAGPTINAFFGSPGADGYVRLSWIKNV